MLFFVFVFAVRDLSFLPAGWDAGAPDLGGGDLIFTQAMKRRSVHFDRN